MKKRQMEYAEFIEKVQWYIINLKEEDKKLRKEMAKQKDPFETKENQQVKVVQSLKYAEEEEQRSKLRMRKMRSQDVGGEIERTAAQRIQNFISKIQRVDEKREEGGITWLELYIWYFIHKGTEEELLLEPKDILQKEMAKFKQAIRAIANNTVDQDEEWHLQTCYARKNRFSGIAISNKHAAIQGIPYINEEDAKKITVALLAMKGAYKKKHREAHQDDNLKLHKKPLTYRGSAAEWKRVTAKGEDWTKHAAPHVKDLEPEETLKKLICPECGAKNDAARFKLKQKSNLSNLKCTTCMKVNSSKYWSCTCGIRWLKCRMHVKRSAEEGGMSSKSTKRKIDDKGIEQPFPKRRGGEEQIVLDRTQRPPGHGQVVLNPGTKLAMKFPHLVRREAG